MPALRSDDVELIVIAGPRARDEQLPIANAADPHRMPTRIPEVKIADHANPLSIGSPDRKRRSFYAVDFGDLCAEFPVNVIMISLSKQMQINSPQDCSE